MDEEVEKINAKCRELIEKAKTLPPYTGPRIWARRSSLHQLVNTKEKAEMLMLQLDYLTRKK